MRRSCGVLLPITSLPSAYGVGDLGPGAYRFVDFLTQSGQSLWQVLPLNPTNPGAGNSPYTSLSSFANNPLLISPERLFEDGYLTKTDLREVPDFPPERVEYAAVTAYKHNLLRVAFEQFNRKRATYEYEQFCSENANWLEDFACFMAFREHFDDRTWCDWPADIRDRQPKALGQLRQDLSDLIAWEKFLQFVFHRQWHTLKTYCNDHQVQIVGDIPYYVSYDSADVWTHPEIFKLTKDKKPAFVAGVPPDYFSTTGQLWGNPVYNWEVMTQSGYAWWIQRIKRCLSDFDMFRIDHFRGFVAYWEVPASEDTAINGKWIEAPAVDFFNALLKYFPNLPIIAEDLGLITPDVREVIQIFGFPGMRLLIFAFDETLPKNPYAPHNHINHCVVYTGTHDNNSIRGWFEGEISDEQQQRIFQYLGRQVPVEDIHQEFVRLALMSIADMVVIPMQDILGLGEEARINFPSKAGGNWQWRLLAEHITPEVSQTLLDMTRLYGRD